MTAVVEFLDKSFNVVYTLTPTETYQRVDMFTGVTVAWIRTTEPNVEYAVYDPDGVTVIATGTIPTTEDLFSNWTGSLYFDFRLASVPPEALPTPVPMGSDAPDVNAERLMSMRWFDNRERWSKERLIDIGIQGDRFPTVRIHRLGLYRTRQWEIVCAASVLQCIVAIEEDAEVLR